jgi:hypothetical protein
MKEIPEGQIHTIPVRFDDCQLPSTLAKLQWVDVFKPDGMKKLQLALEPLLTEELRGNSVTKASVLDPYAEFLEDVIAKGGLIHSDPWQYASSQEVLDFKNLLKGRLDKSWDLIEAGRYHEIIDLWSPLKVFPHFQIEHEEWYDKPFFRCQIQAIDNGHAQSQRHGPRVSHRPANPEI